MFPVLGEPMTTARERRSRELGRWVPWLFNEYASLPSHWFLKQCCSEDHWVRWKVQQSTLILWFSEQGSTGQTVQLTAESARQKRVCATTKSDLLAPAKKASPFVRRVKVFTFLFDMIRNRKSSPPSSHFAKSKHLGYLKRSMALYPRLGSINLVHSILAGVGQTCKQYGCS